LRHIQEQLERHGVQLFDVQIIEREAYRAIFSFGGTIEGLSRKEVSGLDSAIANARAFAGEVVERLKAASASPKQAEVA
jgi:chromosome partitioning protein